MVRSMRVRIRVGDEEFNCSIRAHAWHRAEELNTVDGTIEIEAVSAVTSVHSVLGTVHGRLERAAPNGPFIVLLGMEQIGELIEYAKEESARDGGAHERREQRLRVPDARWVMKDCRIPHTSAPRYAGKARDVLESRFALGSAPWMQDWPLEVCDPARIEEFCAFYDEATDLLVRFDVMQLALFSYDEQPEKSTCSEWFKKTLRRDFAIHGHTVSYWAALDREADDPELHRTDPEFVFGISSLLREIWEASLVPVEVERA